MAKELANTNTTDQLPAGLMEDMEGDKGQKQDFGADMLIIPRISILQDLSPQVKKTNAAYVEGAEVGQFFNNVVNALDSKIKFIPSKFAVRYIAWRPRRAGGGLVSQDLTEEEVRENFAEDGLGRWVGMMKDNSGDSVSVEIIMTPEWVGFAKGEDWDWMPVAMSFPSTKAKAARKINTAIELCVVKGKGGPFSPASFYHTFDLTSVMEQSGDDTWFSYNVSHLGIGKTEKYIVDKAKALKVQLEKGEAQVEDAE